MANPRKKATVRAIVDGVLSDIMIQTSSKNVLCGDELLVDVLARMATQEDINTAISNLINGAPEAYDTLMEIAQYIQEDKDFAQSVQEMFGNKADKSDLDNVVNTLNSLAETVLSLDKMKSTIYFTEEQPESIKTGDLWVQPVKDASVLKDLV